MNEILLAMRPGSWRFTRSTSILLAVAVAFGAVTVFGDAQPAEAAESATVEKIVDGDTLDVEPATLSPGCASSTSTHPR